MYKSFKHDTKWREIENRLNQGDKYPFIGVLIVALEMAALSVFCFIFVTKLMK